jgi:hypothetical protein
LQKSVRESDAPTYICSSHQRSDRKPPTTLYQALEPLSDFAPDEAARAIKPEDLKVKLLLKPDFGQSRLMMDAALSPYDQSGQFPSCLETEFPPFHN